MPDTTRERIIEAATLLLQAGGVDALTMDSAADAAGLSRKTIYNYFENKYSLTDEVADIWLEQLLNKLGSIAGSQEGDAVTRLNSILSVGFSEMHLGERMLRRNKEVKIDPRLHGFQTTLRSKLREFIQELVFDAQEAGLIRQEFNADRMAWVFINLIEGFILLDDCPENPYNKIDLLRDSLRAMVSGVLSERGIAALRDSPIYRHEPQS